MEFLITSGLISGALLTVVILFFGIKWFVQHLGRSWAQGKMKGIRDMMKEEDNGSSK